MDDEEAARIVMMIRQGELELLHSDEGGCCPLEDIDMTRPEKVFQRARV